MTDTVNILKVIIIATVNILEILMIDTVNIFEILMIATVNILEVIIIATVNILEVLIIATVKGIGYKKNQQFPIILTWILGVASKQLRLLHGRVGDSTIVVNSLSPQMRELVEDAIAS